MEQQAIVMINQSFSLFCCAEKYSITFPDNRSLPSDTNYFVCYTYPDGTSADSFAQLTSNSVITSRSPEYDHPCMVHAKLYASHQHREEIAEFSLDLVSPVEYLFRKFSANEFEISDKMASALLAMSLSYYYVMGEHVEKETRTDEILSTLLSCTQHKMYMNTTRQKKDSSSEESITQFAEHFKLQSTLQYLSGGASVGDLPVQLPKPLFPPAKKAVLKKPAVIPRVKINSAPTGGSDNIYQVPNNRPLSEYSVLQPLVDDSDAEYTLMDNSSVHNNRPLSEYSVLQPVVKPDAKYTSMNESNRYSVLDPINPPSNDNDEEYCLMEQTDDSRTHYQKTLRATKSTPVIQASNSFQLRPLSSMENVATDEVYELYDSTITVEAAAATIKRRGPPPRPPAPYRTLDTTKGQSGKKVGNDFESSLESSLQETQITSSVAVMAKEASPFPKKKFLPFHKPRVKRST